MLVRLLLSPRPYACDFHVQEEITHELQNLDCGARPWCLDGCPGSFGADEHGRESRRQCTAADRERAAELAKVEGVTTVENKLEVEGAEKGVAAKTKDATVKGAEKTKDATVKGAEKTKDATVKGAEKTGDKSKDVAGTTGEAITDSWITTKIKADYVNEDTEQIAKTTKGVTRVVNTLTIGPKK
jgi:osmotically-inducible protein OsmY